MKSAQPTNTINTAIDDLIDSAERPKTAAEITGIAMRIITIFYPEDSKLPLAQRCPLRYLQLNDFETYRKLAKKVDKGEILSVACAKETSDPNYPSTSYDTSLLDSPLETTTPLGHCDWLPAVNPTPPTPQEETTQRSEEEQLDVKTCVELVLSSENFSSLFPLKNYDDLATTTQEYLDMLYQLIRGTSDSSNELAWTAIDHLITKSPYINHRFRLTYPPVHDNLSRALKTVFENQKNFDLLKKSSDPARAIQAILNAITLIMLGSLPLTPITCLIARGPDNEITRQMLTILIKDPGLTPQDLATQLNQKTINHSPEMSILEFLTEERLLLWKIIKPKMPRETKAPPAPLLSTETLIKKLTAISESNDIHSELSALLIEPLWRSLNNRPFQAELTRLNNQVDLLEQLQRTEPTSPEHLLILVRLGLTTAIEEGFSYSVDIKNLFANNPTNSYYYDILYALLEQEDFIHAYLWLEADPILKNHADIEQAVKSASNYLFTEANFSKLESKGDKITKIRFAFCALKQRKTIEIKLDRQDYTNFVSNEYIINTCLEAEEAPLEIKAAILYLFTEEPKPLDFPSILSHAYQSKDERKIVQAMSVVLYRQQFFSDQIQEVLRALVKANFIKNIIQKVLVDALSNPTKLAIILRHLNDHPDHYQPIITDDLLYAALPYPDSLKILLEQSRTSKEDPTLILKKLLEKSIESNDAAALQGLLDYLTPDALANVLQQVDRKVSLERIFSPDNIELYFNVLYTLISRPDDQNHPDCIPTISRLIFSGPYSHLDNTVFTKEHYQKAFNFVFRDKKNFETLKKATHVSLAVKFALSALMRTHPLTPQDKKLPSLPIIAWIILACSAEGGIETEIAETMLQTLTQHLTLENLLKQLPTEDMAIGTQIVNIWGCLDGKKAFASIIKKTIREKKLTTWKNELKNFSSPEENSHPQVTALLKKIDALIQSLPQFSPEKEEATQPGIEEEIALVGELVQLLQRPLRSQLHCLLIFVRLGIYDFVESELFSKNIDEVFKDKDDVTENNLYYDMVCALCDQKNFALAIKCLKINPVSVTDSPNKVRNAWEYFATHLDSKDSYKKIKLIYLFLIESVPKLKKIGMPDADYKRLMLMNIELENLRWIKASGAPSAPPAPSKTDNNDAAVSCVNAESPLTRNLAASSSLFASEKPSATTPSASATGTLTRPQQLPVTGTSGKQHFCPVTTPRRSQMLHQDRKSKDTTGEPTKEPSQVPYTGAVIDISKEQDAPMQQKGCRC